MHPLPLLTWGQGRPAKEPRGKVKSRIGHCYSDVAALGHAPLSQPGGQTTRLGIGYQQRPTGTRNGHPAAYLRDPEVFRGGWEALAAQRRASGCCFSGVCHPLITSCQAVVEAMETSAALTVRDRQGSVLDCAYEWIAQWASHLPAGHVIAR